MFHESTWSPTRVAHNWFDTVWNQKQVEAIPHLFVGEASGVDPSDLTRTVDPDAYTATWHLFQDHIADLHIEVVECLESGTRAAVRYRITGTHRASGRAVSFEGAGFIDTHEGRILDAWNVVDFMGLATQVEPALPVDAVLRLFRGDSLVPPGP